MCCGSRRKRAEHIQPARRGAEFCLRALLLHSTQQPRRARDPKPLGYRPGQQLRLIEPPLSQSALMERYGYDRTYSDGHFIRRKGGEQPAERIARGSPAVVLEPAKGKTDCALVGCH
jgi:hypothetical protein